MTIILYLLLFFLSFFPRVSVFAIVCSRIPFFAISVCFFVCFFFSKVSEGSVGGKEGFSKRKPSQQKKNERMKEGEKTKRIAKGICKVKNERNNGN